MNQLILTLASACAALAAANAETLGGDPDRGRDASFMASAPTTKGRERARDWVVHLEEGIVRDVPLLPRLCDSLDLRKEKIAVGDCKLYCEQEGDGIPMILINGGPGGNHHDFHPGFTRAKEFAQVVYYDQRGCGLSDYWPGQGSTLDQAVDDLEQLRKGLGVESWVVLGWSYGGLVAQSYALKYPERLRGLVLLSAATGLLGPWEDSRQQEFISRQEQNKIDELWRTPGLSRAQFMFNKALNGDWKRQSYYRPSREKMARDALYGWVNDNGFHDAISRSLNDVDREGLFLRCPLLPLLEAALGAWREPGRPWRCPPLAPLCR